MYSTIRKMRDFVDGRKLVYWDELLLNCHHGVQWQARGPSFDCFASVYKNCNFSYVLVYHRT